mmetsp:Transcript_9284/g.38072  ORF Transcript_9284/g.38072 Transcript_9284/m.38072 type:complete len:294 (-) Transcript_9284:20-901(-)
MADGDAEEIVDGELVLQQVGLRSEEPREQLGLDVEELHHVDLLALVGARPDVHQEAREIVREELGVEAGDADAGEQQGGAEAEHDGELPRLLVRQLLERAHVRPHEVDRQQVRHAERAIIQERRRGTPELEAEKRRAQLEVERVGPDVGPQEEDERRERERGADVGLRHGRRRAPGLEDARLERLALEIRLAQRLLLLLEQRLIVVLVDRAAAQRGEDVSMSRMPTREKATRRTTGCGHTVLWRRAQPSGQHSASRREPDGRPREAPPQRRDDGGALCEGALESRAHREACGT